MKDMGRYGHVAFCAILLFYCSFITASSPHLSVKRKDGVSEVNMTSVLQTMEMDISNQTQPSVNNSISTESTPHTDTTAGMVVNSTTPMENTSFSENVTDSRNMSDVSHVQNQTAATAITPTTLLPSTTHESITSFHTATHTTITASNRTTHSSSPESGGDPSSTAAQITHTFTSSSSSPIQARAHLDTPSALNVGDEDSNKVSTDPLLAGLVSAFVVVAAIVSVLVFLKFRNTNDGPEFRRLQDLPMDDMLEDAPLSMYSY
ncbi:serine-rich adhesin for platelets [Danio aesculapii]|uniref:serine-rich adhesin for platelets n=1 Tax=Danio aesculapii TaxID=1142201 RepID=UPI0024C0194D|nr:serine-rich adhesin for platelets [Danio aesculapii]